MLRSGLFVLALLATCAATATTPSFTGTWSAMAATGTPVTLQLQQDASGQVSGSLVFNGSSLQIKAQLQQGQVVGLASNQQGAVYFQAQLANADLNVVLAALGPNGQPIPGQAQQILMTRAGAGMASSQQSGPMGQAMSQQPMGAAPPSGAAMDPFAGTFQGQNLAITLQRSGAGYTGTAQSSAGQFPVQAQVVSGVLNGLYTDRGMARYFQAAVQGDVMQLQADGSIYTLQRQVQTVAGMGQPGQMGGAAPPASTPQDQQISQFLTASRWCSFSYNQTTGHTATEQVRFFPDGTMVRGQQGETQMSNPYGTYAGASQGGDRGRWRIQNGQLMLSQDGMQWAPTPLQITRNSSGYPIVTAGGTEYTQCN